MHAVASSALLAERVQGESTSTIKVPENLRLVVLTKQ